MVEATPNGSDQVDRSLGFRPGDVDPGRFQYYKRAGDDMLLSSLIGILKRGGNSWVMPKGQFEQIVAEIGSRSVAGGLASFIGIGSLERIAALGALEVGDDTVALRGEIIEYQVRHNLRALPSWRRSIANRFGK